MDPIGQAITKFQEQFRAAQEKSACRLVLVLCESGNLGTLIQVLRGEEWQPDNKSPFLIFDTPFANPQDTYKTMGSIVVQHYRLLRKGLAEQGVQLREWSLAAVKNEEPLASFIRHARTYHQNLAAPLQGLWICWLPGGMSDNQRWLADIRGLQKALPAQVRFIIADGKGSPTEEWVASLGDNAAIVSFDIDDKALLEHFKQLSAPSGPSKPHPGTLPGSARPDVEPPPRRHGPKQSSEEDLKVAIAADKIPAMLLPSQGVKLREYILEAASAAGANRPEEALKWQQQACDLCAKAGVKLEQALMNLVLASYLVQFKLHDKAGPKYCEAAALAEQAGAFPQVAQARLAHAYLLLTRQQPDQAAKEYEAAGAAADKGQSAMLAIEALRMAGTCHLQRGRKEDAMRCWQKAVAAGAKAAPGELPHTSFEEVGRGLIKLLREQRLEAQAVSVERLMETTAASAQNEAREVGS